MVDILPEPNMLKQTNVHTVATILVTHSSAQTPAHLLGLHRRLPHISAVEGNGSENVELLHSGTKEEGV